MEFTEYVAFHLTFKDFEELIRAFSIIPSCVIPSLALAAMKLPDCGCNFNAIDFGTANKKTKFEIGDEVKFVKKDFILMTESDSLMISNSILKLDDSLTKVLAEFEGVATVLGVVLNPAKMSNPLPLNAWLLVVG